MQTTTTTAIFVPYLASQQIIVRNLPTQFMMFVLLDLYWRAMCSLKWDVQLIFISLEREKCSTNLNSQSTNGHCFRNIVHCVLRFQKKMGWQNYYFFLLSYFLSYCRLWYNMHYVLRHIRTQKKKNLTKTVF